MSTGAYLLYVGSLIALAVCGVLAAYGLCGIPWLERHHRRRKTDAHAE
jgi:hypothetical protein